MDFRATNIVLTVFFFSTLLIGCGGTGSETSRSNSSSSGNTSSSSSGNTTSSPAAASYCPKNSPCKILPLGDNTTQGIERDNALRFVANGGYRPYLFEMALNDNFVITFVGSMADGPQTVAGMEFPAKHEGHAGWLTRDFLDILPAPALNDNPNIILLYIGAMDMLTNEKHDAPSHLVKVVNTITSSQPNALLVIATLPEAYGDLGPVTRFNSAVRSIASQNDSDRIITAELNRARIGPYAIYPNSDGYRAMAQAWYDAIRPYL